ITGRHFTCFQLHRGSYDVIWGNICDEGPDGPYQNIVFYQGADEGVSVSGNSFTNNIVIAGSQGFGGGYLGDWSPMSITSNAYFNYVGSWLNWNGAGYGVSDAYPVYANPQFTCWTFDIAGGSSVYNWPVNFPGVSGGWGPPGFVFPWWTGTRPSGC